MVLGVDNLEFNLMLEMATKFDDIECAICNDCLVDPRALPCGHCYCGPPRTCLNSMENDSGGLRCAVCRIDHNSRACDIKPLYGIRDCFQGTPNSRLEQSPNIPCSMHIRKECTFWCNQCGFMVCLDCTEDEHGSHSVRNLKKYLVEKIEARFGKPFLNKLVEYAENLRMSVKSASLELEHWKLQMEDFEKELSKAKKQTDVIDEYIRVVNGGLVPKHVNEIFLLLKLSKMETLKTNLFPILKTARSSTEEIERSTQTEVEELQKISVSTQFEEFDCASISSESQSPSNLIENQPKTEVSIFTSANLVELENQVPSSSNACNKSGISSLQKNCPNYPDAILNVITTSQIIKTKSVSRQTGDSLSTDVIASEKEKNQLDLATCDYFVLRHNTDLWCFSITLRGFLEVKTKEPLSVIVSDNLVVCPFDFQIDADVVENRLQNYQETLRIIVTCCSSDGSLLPSSIFCYGLKLHNHMCLGNKTKNGTWNYPNNKKLFWYCLPHAELIKPNSGWISDSNYIEVTLQLMR